MFKRNVHYYLIKAARLSGWLLLPLMLLYILTGFALCAPKGGLEHWMARQVKSAVTSRQALAVHRIFEWPLIVLFVVHAALTIYFALWRWGWIKTRKSRKSQ